MPPSFQQFAEFFLFLAPIKPLLYKLNACIHYIGARQVQLPRAFVQPLQFFLIHPDLQLEGLPAFGFWWPARSWAHVLTSLSAMTKLYNRHDKKSTSFIVRGRFFVLHTSISSVANPLEAW